MLTNQGLHAIHCGQDIGERKMTRIPTDAMAINLYASTKLGKFNSIGIQYSIVPVEAENGFILNSLKQVESAGHAGRVFAQHKGLMMKSNMRN